MTAADNIVHLALVRLKDAPPGVKGISLFLIPKKRIKDDGSLESNDVNCAGIYHKLGYRGAPITQLAFGENDDCRGYLVGEANKGLGYMFQMMNGARIDVGLGAACISSAAYYASLEYARERPQGRKLTSKDPSVTTDTDHRTCRHQAHAFVPEDPLWKGRWHCWSNAVFMKIWNMSRKARSMKTITCFWNS